MPANARYARRCNLARTGPTYNRELVTLGSVYRDRVCLVIGHTGFKGSWLSLWLHELGARVTGYALDVPTQPALFEQAGVDELVEDVRGDVRHAERFTEVVQHVQPEVVFHLAAQPIVRESYQRPKETFDTNVGGTVNLLEAVRACPTVRAVVVITSDKCYENREWEHAYRETDRLGGYDPYSASKAAAEIVCSAYSRSFLTAAGVPLATARAGNVIAGGDWGTDRILPDVVRALRAGQPAGVRSPDAVRPWQHVLEPLGGYLLLGARMLTASDVPDGPMPYAGPWNFGPAPESCRPVADLVESFLAAYGEGSWEDLCRRQGDAPHEARLLALAWDKAYRRLGWHPRWTFDRAVRETSQWYARQAAGESGGQLCLEQIRAYTKGVREKQSVRESVCTDG